RAPVALQRRGEQQQEHHVAEQVPMITVQEHADDGRRQRWLRGGKAPAHPAQGVAVLLEFFARRAPAAVDLVKRGPDLVDMLVPFAIEPVLPEYLLGERFIRLARL